MTRSGCSWSSSADWYFDSNSCSISIKELVGLKTVLRDDGTRAIGRITWMQPGSNINQRPSRRTTRCFTSESINTQSSLQFL